MEEGKNVFETADIESLSLEGGHGLSYGRQVYCYQNSCNRMWEFAIIICDVAFSYSDGKYTLCYTTRYREGAEKSSHAGKVNGALLVGTTWRVDSVSNDGRGPVLSQQWSVDNEYQGKVHTYASNIAFQGELLTINGLKPGADVYSKCTRRCTKCNDTWKNETCDFCDEHKTNNKCDDCMKFACQRCAVIHEEDEYHCGACFQSIIDNCEDIYDYVYTKDCSEFDIVGCNVHPVYATEDEFDLSI